MRCDWDKVEWQEVIPGYRAKFIHTDSATFALWHIIAGVSLPAHSHPHEQITQLLQGKFELTVDDIRHDMKNGDIVFIAPNAKHSAVPLTDCVVLDIFHPRRDDYMVKNFTNLNG